MERKLQMGLKIKKDGRIKKKKKKITRKDNQVKIKSEKGNYRWE